MPLRSMRLHNRHDNSGFTLVEILVVVLIVGVLSSIAVLAYQNQRAKANEAQVVTDVRNAATVMEDAYIDDSRYPANLPSAARVTPDTRIYNDVTLSGPQNYCLTGTHHADPDISVSYDSLQGGILPQGENCLPATEREDGSWGAPGGGDTWSEVLNETTVLVVADRRVSQNQSWLVSAEAIFGRVGIPAENVLVHTGITDVNEIREIDPDVVVSLGRKWTPLKEALLRDAQSEGYSILTDGDDVNRTNFSHIISSSRHVSGTGAEREVGMAPTYASVSPAFPYIFDATTHTEGAGDSWVCIENVTANATIVATFEHGTGTCASLVTHRNNGLWFHAFQIEHEPASAALSAGMLWLLS